MFRKIKFSLMIGWLVSAFVVVFTGLGDIFPLKVGVLFVGFVIVCQNIWTTIKSRKTKNEIAQRFCLLGVYCGTAITFFDVSNIWYVIAPISALTMLILTAIDNKRKAKEREAKWGE